MNGILRRLSVHFEILEEHLSLKYDHNWKDFMGQIPKNIIIPFII